MYFPSTGVALRIRDLTSALLVADEPFPFVDRSFPKSLLEVVQRQWFLEEGLLFLVGEKLFGDFAQVAVPQIGL